MKKLKEEKLKEEITKIVLIKNNLGVLKPIVTDQYIDYLENKIDKLEKLICKK